MSAFGGFADALYPVDSCDRETLALLSLFPRYRPRAIAELWYFAVNALACKDDAALAALLTDIAGWRRNRRTPTWWLEYFTSDDTKLTVYWSDGCATHTLGATLHQEDAPALVREDGTEVWYLNGEEHSQQCSD
jgi:hypothetical protein